jgi:hypothetical protein
VRDAGRLARLASGGEVSAVLSGRLEVRDATGRVVREAAVAPTPFRETVRTARARAEEQGVAMAMGAVLQAAAPPHRGSALRPLGRPTQAAALHGLFAGAAILGTDGARLMNGAGVDTMFDAASRAPRAIVRGAAGSPASQIELFARGRRYAELRYAWRRVDGGWVLQHVTLTLALTGQGSLVLSVDATQLSLTSGPAVTDAAVEEGCEEEEPQSRAGPGLPIVTAAECAGGWCLKELGIKGAAYAAATAAEAFEALACAPGPGPISELCGAAEVATELAWIGYELADAAYAACKYK